MNAMKFTEIYAASVRDMKQQAGRDLASREVLTASLSCKILRVPVSKRSFKRGISSAQILKGEILNGKFRALNFKSGLAATEATRRCEFVKFKGEFQGAWNGLNF